MSNDLTGMPGIEDDHRILWKVLATDSRGIVQYEQEFCYHVDRPAYNPEAMAYKNAARIRGLFPECSVSVTALTHEDLKR
jgi:hypothetical protein